MKIYYFLNSVKKENFEFFQEKLLHLVDGRDTPKSLINKFFYKIGDDNKGRINFGFFIEALMFIEFIKEKYSLKDYSSVLELIEWVNGHKNFYIYNEEIFISEGGILGYSKISLKEKVYFITSRDIWINPFFRVLYKLSEIKQNLSVIRPNTRKGWIYNDDKISNISKLYQKRKELVGDFVTHYFLNNDVISFKVFLDDIRTRMGDKVVLKKNNSEYGKGVKMLNLSNINTEESIKKLYNNFFANSYESIYSTYIVPYYQIKKEYRVYYTHFSGTTKVFAIKNRVNIDSGDVFEKDSYTMYKEVSVKWNYIPKDFFGKSTKYYKFIDSIAKSLGYDKGVIEVIELENGELIYSELNTLGASLMFPEDEDDMMNYHLDIISKCFNKKS